MDSNFEPEKLRLTQLMNQIKVDWNKREQKASAHQPTAMLDVEIKN